MYKDPEKQKQAVRDAVKRSRQRKQGITPKGITSEGITSLNVTPDVIPDKPANFGQPNCECKHCQSVRSNKSNHVLNHGPHKSASELSLNELNRVALPGDVDYRGAYQG